jgi:predicted  nucleic acid-binding Zn-ribbon protein
MSQISILYRLQQIDSQLDNAKIALLSVEKELSDDSQIITAQQNVDQAVQHHKSELKRLHDSENKSYDTRIKIELAETSLYGGKIQNPKELQELQNEIASLKRLIITLEDNELEAMMATEDAEAKLTTSQNEFDRAQGRQIEINAKLNGDRTKLLSQIERLEAERKATLPPISASDLSLYEQLRKSRNGAAVVIIASRACTACGTTLTAALIQSVQSTGQLIRCPTCGRILYPG